MNIVTNGRGVGHVCCCRRRCVLCNGCGVGHCRCFLLVIIVDHSRFLLLVIIDSLLSMPNGVVRCMHNAVSGVV